MLALREHYSGEDHASRRIANAERMREGLHYKNERALAFSTFFDRMQKMFNIYEEEEEEFTENAKLRELFKQVQHSQLQDTIKALKVRFDMEGIRYTQAANHLTITVSELPDYHLTRKVSASSSGTPRIRGGRGNNQNSNIKRKGGMQAPTKAYSCQMDRFSQDITQTGGNYQNKTSRCWIHETRKRREVLATSDKFQASLPSQNNNKS